MFKDIKLGTAHLDEMKGVGEPLFLRPYFEVLLDEDALVNAEKIVNLFAGNCNESVLTQEYLNQVGNTKCVIIAVDKSAPTWKENLVALEQSLGDRFQLIISDAIEYLKFLPENSIDILTAFGAEYVFSRDPRPQLLETYLSEVKRVLKVGGFVISPSIHLPGESQGFEQIGPLAMARKIHA